MAGSGLLALRSIRGFGYRLELHSLAPPLEQRGKHYVQPRGYAAIPGTGPANRITKKDVEAAYARAAHHAAPPSTPPASRPSASAEPAEVTRIPNRGR